MSHDLYSSWATAEVSRMIKENPNLMFRNGNINNLTVYANRESGRIWPIPDGRISAEIHPDKFEIAIELKRHNEGLHGILTAIGQSQSYIFKGYSGAAIVIPRSYDSFADPGLYVSNVINTTRNDLSVGVFVYESPDANNVSPFFNKITCVRQIGLTPTQSISINNFLYNQKSKTQWAHLREGSSESFAFFKYLQIAKTLNAADLIEPVISLPDELIDAVSRIRPGTDPHLYLSFSPGISFHDIVWRTFWYSNVLTHSVAIIWNKLADAYIVNHVPTGLTLKDGSRQYFFSSRTDSIKQEIVNSLNTREINENEAWELFALNVHNRAHSYREDIDSGLTHLGLIDSDGKPSEVGYKFVDACERTNDCHSGKPWLILGSSILQTGGLGAFLHYIFKVSETEFGRDPMAFTTLTADGARRFNQDAYLNFLRNQLANVLNVMNTSMARGGSPRKAFQGEFAILRKFDFVSNFRIGVGLEINWPLIQEYLSFKL